MSLHADLLEQAEHLAKRERRRPKQASLRRSVSAAYYALFHLLTHEASGLFIKESEDIQAVINRCYNHVEMNKVSRFFANGKLPEALEGNADNIPSSLTSTAETFTILQGARHDADYNIVRKFTRKEAQIYISQVKVAFKNWNQIRNSDIARLYLGCFHLWKTWDNPRR